MSKDIAEALVLLLQNPQILLPYAVVFAFALVLSNLDKLANSLGRKRRWESEQARIEANRKHWELEHFKLNNGLTGEDPFPLSRVGSSGVPPAEADTNINRPGAWRFGYAFLGSYLMLLLIYVAALTDRTQPTQSVPFYGAWLAMAIIAVVPSLIVTFRKRVKNLPFNLISAGATTSLATLLTASLLFVFVIIVLAINQGSVN